MQEKKIHSSYMSHCLAALGYSYDGLKACFADEAAFRLICFEGCICISLAIFLCRSWCEGILLILPSILAFTVELLNTAIENTVDLVTNETHILAKKAKDMGSCAQFCVQIFLFCTWLSYVIMRIFF